jgi:WD40 repeat protein
LKSHLDSIRGIHFVPSINSLVSASEDCTLKVWDVNKFCSLKDVEGVVNFEPYVTMRSHLSPIISLCGSDMETNPNLGNLLISGSSNGVIKIWKIPALN